jgi:uncharacterized protein (DUF736 family)
MNNKENTGAIFKNDKKAENQPDWKGKINVNGKDLEIALWQRVSQNGVNYLSAKVSEPYNKEQNGDTGLNW